MKKGIYKIEEDKDEEYGNSFTMEYRGVERNAVKLGRKFGFNFKGRILENFYLFSKDGVPDRSTYKTPLPVATMRSFDKKLVSMSQTKMEPFSNNLETVTRVEREAVDITNDGLETLSLWYFKENASMGVYEAWSRGYAGNGIVITIASDGTQIDHPDLADNFVSTFIFILDMSVGLFQNESLGYDYILDIPGGYNVATTDVSGTLLAGFAAGVNNNECVTGLAYNATFASLRLISDNEYLSDYSIAQSLTRRLDVVDIHVRTWSYVRGGQLYKYFTTLEKSAVEKGISEGRGGKGLIYVTGTLLTHYEEDCNTDPFPSSIYTITVNAVRTDGSAMNLAEQCTAVMVSAFAGVYGSYAMELKSTFVNSGCGRSRGPAAATMFVSSAIALALEANYELTYRDVQHIIVETASPDAITGTNFTVNGVGKKVSPAVGFGLVNVSAMVETAETWRNVPDLVKCTGPLLSPFICCEDDLGHNFTVDQCHINYVEHVEVYVHFKVVWREYTEIHLISPQDGTLGGHFTVETPCQNDTYPLVDVDICIHCNLAGYRVVNGICAKDGSLGGKCDGNIICEPVGSTLACDETTLRCVNCTNGWRPIDGLCVQDGTFFGYCDETIQCKGEIIIGGVIQNFGCVASVNRCDVCIIYESHSLIDSVCIKDGTLGGRCNLYIPCTTSGTGCNVTTLVCTDCTMKGYRYWDHYCFKDGMLDGYCDKDILCMDGSSCDPVTQSCVECTASNYRDVYGYCMKDGLLGGYCSDLVPCIFDNSACLRSMNICINCLKPNYLEDGFCTIVEETSDEIEKSEAYDTRILAGIGIGTVILGVICSLIGSYFLMKKSMTPKVQPGSSPKVTIINVMKRE
ncbi:Proprotein convertase subtilisin/kexin type 6 [Mactra antiquata]